MLKRAVVIHLLAGLLFAYDPVRLDINAKVFSKLLMLDSNPSATRRSGGISVLFDPAEERFAKALRVSLERYSPATPVHLVSYRDFKGEAALGYFLLSGSKEENIKKVADTAVAKGVISYTINPKDLKQGIMLALRMEQKVYPELNPEAIRRAGIQFQPILFRIAKQYQP